MDEEDELGVEYGLKAYQALRTKKRVLTLIGLKRGMTLNEIAESLDMSYGGIYAYVEDLEEANLVENRNGTRRVTPFGKIALTQLRSLNDQLKREAEQQEEQEPEQKQSLTDLTAEDLEEIVNEETL